MLNLRPGYTSQCQIWHLTVCSSVNRCQIWHLIRDCIFKYKRMSNLTSHHIYLSINGSESWHLSVYIFCVTECQIWQQAVYLGINGCQIWHLAVYLTFKCKWFLNLTSHCILIYVWMGVKLDRWLYIYQNVYNYCEVGCDSCVQFYFVQNLDFFAPSYIHGPGPEPSPGFQSYPCKCGMNFRSVTV